MSDVSNKTERRPDRFDQLAVEYAEAYLGRRKVDRMLGRDDDAAAEPSWFDRWLHRLRG